MKFSGKFYICHFDDVSTVSSLFGGLGAVIPHHKEYI